MLDCLISFRSDDDFDSDYVIGTAPPVIRYLHDCKEQIVFIEMWLKRNCKGRWKFEVIGDKTYLIVEYLTCVFENPSDAAYFKLKHLPQHDWVLVNNY